MMWYDNPVWTEALASFLDKVRAGDEIRFNAASLEAALYEAPIFEYVDAILQQEANPDIDGRRYVPRLMMALLIRLNEIASNVEGCNS